MGLPRTLRAGGRGTLEARRNGAPREHEHAPGLTCSGMWLLSAMAYGGCRLWNTALALRAGIRAHADPLFCSRHSAPRPCVCDRAAGQLLREALPGARAPLRQDPGALGALPRRLPGTASTMPSAVSLPRRLTPSRCDAVQSLLCQQGAGPAGPAVPAVPTGLSERACPPALLHEASSSPAFRLALSATPSHHSTTLHAAHRIRHQPLS